MLFCLIRNSHFIYQVNIWNICWLHCWSFCKVLPIKVAGQKNKSKLKLFYDLLKADYFQNFNNSNNSNKISPKR